MSRLQRRATTKSRPGRQSADSGTKSRRGSSSDAHLQAVDRKHGVELPRDYFERITKRADFDEILRRLAKV